MNDETKGIVFNGNTGIEFTGLVLNFNRVQEKIERAHDYNDKSQADYFLKERTILLALMKKALENTSGTKEQALHELKKLKHNDEFMKLYDDDDTDAVAEFQRLQLQAYGID